MDAHDLAGLHRAQVHGLIERHAPAVLGDQFSILSDHPRGHAVEQDPPGLSTGRSMTAVTGPQGFMLPRSPDGRASIVPAPPSGTAEATSSRSSSAPIRRTSPRCCRRVSSLRQTIPGAVAIIWADWQSCSASGDELMDPVRSQYKEAFVVVRCVYGGATYSRCVYIWVDKDFALARGSYFGYPKKLGQIWMTRPVSVGRAGPRLEAGGAFGATLAANDRRLADVALTLTGESDTGGFVNALSMLHSRWMPNIEPSEPASLDELVTMRSQDVELGPVFTGVPTVTLYGAPARRSSPPWSRPR